MNEETYFGSKKIDKNLKQSLVGKVFSNVASRYDIMNDAMSFGIHRYWKRMLLTQLKNTKYSLLDVAGGTGDIAKLYYQKSKLRDHNPYITICDINNDMLNVGRDKLINNNINNINYLCANAENLSIIDNSFDYYTIAFGIRNVTNIQKALDEAYRVLKPGGKFICLEFAQIDNELLAKIYDFYSFNVIPFMGKVIAGDSDSYKYLVESIRKFPHKEKFLSMIEISGFRECEYINLSNGVCAIWFGYKI